MRAMRPHRHQSPDKERACRKSETIEIRSGQRATFREWLLIDELALGLEVALVRFPGTGSRQHELLEGLERTPGVRHIIDRAHARDVYAVVLFQGARGRRELRARLEELAEAFFWDDVLWESQLPAIASWLSLAKESATRDGLAYAFEENDG
jgi:plasmid stabilization system protein ParE